MEFDGANSMIVEGDQIEEIAVMTRSFNCGHRRSQDLEDNIGGRPNSPRYNLADKCRRRGPRRLDPVVHL